MEEFAAVCSDLHGPSQSAHYSDKRGGHLNVCLLDKDNFAY